MSAGAQPGAKHVPHLYSFRVTLAWGPKIKLGGVDSRLRSMLHRVSNRVIGCMSCAVAPSLDEAARLILEATRAWRKGSLKPG
jgi:hypothetical protein